jgi:predicted unusual protein kinase regulating ubiquinone biosynthesis (AarF/ABC1/UbiB family)
LLDTGFFHADPHPGNMIRTPDGKLAILDFGKPRIRNIHK